MQEVGGSNPLAPTDNLEKNPYPERTGVLLFNFEQDCNPLGAGFLTGKIDSNTTFDSPDFRNISLRFAPRKS